MRSDRSIQVHGVHIPFSWRNILGYATGRLIQLVEGKNYCHFYPVLIKGDGYPYSAWNIFGWFNTWSSYRLDTLTSAYENLETWEIPLSDEEAWKLQEKWTTMKGRQYAVGRLFLLPIYRLTGWNLLTKPPGITCASSIAMGLDSIDLWKHPTPPSMAGLREVEDVLVKLKDRKVG